MISDEVSGIALISPFLANGEDSLILLSAIIFHDLVIVGCINTEKHQGDGEGEEERLG
jgi:hypothetical protein